MKIYFLFEFQLVPFAFGLILGDLFMMPPALSVERWQFFQKRLFMGGQILGDRFMGGLFYMPGIMIRSCKGREEFHKMHFLVIWTL